MRVGVVAGAGIAASLAGIGVRGAPLDAFALLIIALGAAAGACLGGAVILTAIHVRRAPIALLKAGVFLAVVSVFILGPYGADAFRAHRFLAHADSARGVVTLRYTRGDTYLQARYVASGSAAIASDQARRSTADVQVGDTVLVFLDPTAPGHATIGEPGPDWTHAFRSLVPLWAIGGVLFLGYGIGAIPAGVPEGWRFRVRLLRAYFGAAAMADIGFVLLAVSQADLHDPRQEVVRVFWFSLFMGAPFSLIFTLVLGGLAFAALYELRWTGPTGYAVSGVVLGSVGSLMLWPAGLLVGPVSGLLAALTFWWLLFWGGAPFERPRAAA